MDRKYQQKGENTMVSQVAADVSAAADVRELKGPWVSDIQPGDEFIGFYVARNPRLDPYRDPSKGKFMRLLLSDRTGYIQARIWEDAELAAEEIDNSKPIKVDGVAELYNGAVQVHIRRFRLAREGEFQREDLIKASSRNVERMWAAVRDAIDKVQDPHLESLLRFFFDDIAFTSKFLEIPAARVIHHATLSGLLEHCYELILLAQPLIKLYPEIDRDLLVAGILLHDVGKLEEYDYEYDTSVTDAGKLVGHVVLSERIVSRAMSAIGDFSKSRENEILHLIVSHHGRYEWGAARRPKSLEAIALHHLDNLDAQVNRFKLLLERAREEGKPWTDYDRLLGRMLYIGERNGLTLEENGLVD
jgi:3'-5' exoribonuclease